MGRYLRDVPAGSTNHIWFKTLGDIFALVHDVDLLVLEAYMVIYKLKHGIRIQAYSLMSNHVHLLLENSEVDPDAVSCFMRDVKREFSKYYNIAYGRNGAFWQTGFGNKQACDERQFVIEVVYILNNPVKARLCAHAGEFAHGAFTLVTEKKVLNSMKHEGRFMSMEDAKMVIARSKRVGYAGRLPEEARIARGLGWDLSDKRLMPLVHQGRRQYKRRGPMPYWHPEDDRRTVSKIPRFLALAVLDESRNFGRLDPQELSQLCRERSGMDEASWQRVDGMRICFESGSKKTCQAYQAEHMDNLPPNAQLPRSIIATGRGTWAVVAIRGRPRQEK